MNVLDNFIGILFCFHIFSVKRSIDVLDSENQPGSGKIRKGIQRTSDTKSMKTKTKNRAADPVFDQNRILIHAVN